jgi:hypothetical protein
MGWLLRGQEVVLGDVDGLGGPLGVELMKPRTT